MANSEQCSNLGYCTDQVGMLRRLQQAFNSMDELSGRILDEDPSMREVVAKAVGDVTMMSLDLPRAIDQITPSEPHAGPNPCPLALFRSEIAPPEGGSAPPNTTRET